MNASDLEVRLSEQATSLYAIDGFAQQFHPPESNNFVFMLLPKDQDPLAFSHAWGDLTQALNSADRSLLTFCVDHVKKHPDIATTLLLHKWNECILNRVNLNGGRWADQVIRRLTDSGTIEGTFANHLKHHAPNVIEKFLAVPQPLLEIVRFNLYLSPKQQLYCLEKLLAREISPALHTVVQRIEVAKTLQEYSGQDHVHNRYPTLIFYLKENLEGAVLAGWIKQLTSLCRSFDNPVPARTEGAYLWQPNCTVTQGFMLYKRYLKWLGIIDEIYSFSSNHGLAHDSKVMAFLQ